MVVGVDGGGWEVVGGFWGWVFSMGFFELILLGVGYRVIDIGTGIYDKYIAFICTYYTVFI